MVRDFYLFLDTETSGLPRQWNQPYTDSANWPFIVQIAWVVYQADTRQEVARRDFYIRPDDFEVSKLSQTIHGLSPEFLLKNGQARAVAMQQLYQDILTYNPLIVSHFFQLDYHMMRLGFNRIGLDNPLKNVAGFCTMLHTHTFMQAHEQRYLRLNELYERLFKKAMPAQHHAMVDAEATAQCFFALVQQQDITTRTIQNQQARHTFRQEITPPPRQKPRLATLAVVIGASILLVYLLWNLLER